jgi:hypothetical protein
MDIDNATGMSLGSDVMSFDSGSNMSFAPDEPSGSSSDATHQYNAANDYANHGHVVQRSIAHQRNSTLQGFRDAYIASYADDTVSNPDRMDHANVLAVSLLREHFPAKDGYIVLPSSLGPVARDGMNFMLKGSDWTDPEFMPLPLQAPSAPKKNRSKGKSKKPTAKALLARKKKEAQEAYVRDFSQYYHFTASCKWHTIEPEDIEGLVVLKKVNSNGNGMTTVEAEYRPHTYLAIIVDDLTKVDLFADTNEMHRGDILADVLSRNAKIQSGYGILMFGTRIEFYDFDNGMETKVEDGIFIDEATGEEVDYKVTSEEPFLAMTEHPDGEGDLVVDMRDTRMDVVGQAFKHMAAQNVVYIEDVTGGGELQTRNAVEHGPEDLAGGTDHVAGDTANQEVAIGDIEDGLENTDNLSDDGTGTMEDVMETGANGKFGEDPQHDLCAKRKTPHGSI